MSRRQPRTPGGPGPGDAADAGGFDEVAFGGADPVDPGSLLGPVDEFTLSVALEGTEAPTDEQQRSAGAAEAADSPPPARSPRAEQRARRLPLTPPRAPARPTDQDPLTTGVIPAIPEAQVLSDPSVLPPPPDERAPARPGVSDATAALLMEGLVDELPLPLSEPSVGLPEVMMPPADTGRARPLRPDGRPPVISLDPQPRVDPGAAPRATPRPAGSRAEAWRPAARSRPAPPSGEDRAAPRDETRPVSLAGPPGGPPVDDAPLRPLPQRPAAPPAPDTAAVQRLDQLLTLADEPPEREETLSSALELLSLADAPPEREETIGGSMVRIAGEAEDAPPPPRRQDAAVHQRTPAPPAQRRATSASFLGEGGALPPAALEPDGPSLDDLDLPPATTAAAPPAPSPAELGDLETRPIQALPEPPAHHREADFVRPPHQRVLNSAQLRRETYRPPTATMPPSATGATPSPQRRTQVSPGDGAPRSTPPPAPPPAAPAPRRERAVQPDEATAGPGLRAEPVLMWAATLIGMLVFGAFALLVILAVTWLV